MPSILIVDDDASFLEVLVEVLQPPTRTPTPILTARTGTETLAIIDTLVRDGIERNLEFALIDYDLPDTNAAELVRRLRSRSAFRTLPILVMSQSDSPAVKTAAKAAGATDFTPKPWSVDDLRATLRSFRRRYTRCVAS